MTSAVWLRGQRYRYKQGQLHPARVQALDTALPGWVTGRKAGPRRAPIAGSQQSGGRGGESRESDSLSSDSTANMTDSPRFNMCRAVEQFTTVHDGIDVFVEGVGGVRGSLPGRLPAKGLLTCSLSNEAGAAGLWREGEGAYPF